MVLSFRWRAMWQMVEEEVTVLLAKKKKVSSLVNVLNINTPTPDVTHIKNADNNHQLYS